MKHFVMLQTKEKLLETLPPVSENPLKAREGKIYFHPAKWQMSILWSHQVNTLAL